ncbi:DUF5004 domain-containing protein [Gelidibacter maritimus]|uniref:DUF5004 domain-containing protein n=1 Tax=Gelidibacter maritimus TaxID=2761487 RepID=A0A7W2M2U5_9FLAO|nr:DUF5004 domain-containing protein [Gelidibacter maritimus]MBA6151658.1 DUF5004 domain-containing protein [Gelidibacter maritimus]
MKKSILSIKSLFVIGALSIFSCNSDDGIKCPEPLTGELSATETAFTGTWNLVAMESDVALDLTNDDEDNPSTDLFNQYSDCDRDLEYHFMADRTLVYRQGYLADECNNKLTFDGTWSLSGNNLTLVANCASQQISIETNAEEDQYSYDVILQFRDVNGAQKTAEVTFTFEKATVDEQPV